MTTHPNPHPLGHLPPPEGSTPTMEQLADWMTDGLCEATDGCIVEPDGECPHGCPSWLIVLGLI